MPSLDGQHPVMPRQAGERHRSTAALRTAALAAGLFSLCFAIANFFTPSLIQTYWTDPHRSFDLNFYVSIAERGYLEPSWAAFYPLWPLILSWYSKILQTSAILPAAHVLSILFFIAATIPMWTLVKNLTNAQTATWIVLLASLNPNAIFHGLAYPESFFCLLATLLVTQMRSYLVCKDKIYLVPVALLTALISATRPILPQLLAAGLGTMVVSSLKHRAKNARDWLIISLVMLLAGILSYIPFGIVCMKTFGNFFQPFASQSLWNRKFGVYWDILLNPKTVGGSDNVLAWELLAFYGPISALVYYIARRLAKHESNDEQSDVSLDIMIFCLIVSAAHGAIAFLTYPIFMSLGRHALATPFIFLGVAGLAAVALQKPSGRKTLFFLTIISAAYLVKFWTRFARLAWIG